MLGAEPVAAQATATTDGSRRSVRLRPDRVTLCSAADPAGRPTPPPAGRQSPRPSGPTSRSARSLREGRKAAGGQQATVWVLPAQQRLGRHDLSGGKADQRLIEQPKLVAFHCVAQLCHERGQLLSLALHRHVKDRVAGLTPGLCRVHRAVRVLDHPIGSGAGASGQWPVEPPGSTRPTPPPSSPT